VSLRIVFDNSTLVGASIRPDSTPDQALQCALGSHELLVSTETLAELERILKKPHLDRYATIEKRMRLAQIIARNSTLVAVSPADLGAVHPNCRDASDDKFLALCLAANADVLVSSDQDLLVLHPWRGIAILTPAQFLQALRK